MNSMLLLLFSSCSLVAGTSAFAPTVPTRQRKSSYSIHNLSSSSEEAERLRQSASKLRQEAEALQKNLDDTAPIRKKQTVTNTPAPPVTYKSLKDSTWTFSYRFSNEPESDDEENDDKNENAPARVSYSGKLTVTFRSDGYTDLISHEPSGRTSLNMEKVWGWDEEESTEKDDDNVYLLFSVSAKADENEERFYWQARVDTNERTKEITLEDGTVTVKRDVKPPGGFWGVFDGAGILAQFRNVGSFVAKSTAART